MHLPSQFILIDIMHRPIYTFVLVSSLLQVHILKID